MDIFLNRLENTLNRQYELYRLSGLMVGLTYPGHAYQLSDEEVVRRWEENPYYQYFCGEEYFRHRFPIDASSLRRALATDVRQPQPPGLPSLIGLADVPDSTWKHDSQQSQVLLKGLLLKKSGVVFIPQSSAINAS